jgi:hypothetical protein
VQALPAPPAVVATYLVDLATTGADPHQGPAKGAKVMTISLALSASAAAHRAAGHALVTRARVIRTAMKGIRKTRAAPQAQAEDLKPETVRRILVRLGDSPIDRRDAALVALLFAGALWRSELAGLDYATAGSDYGYLRLTAEAVEITLLRSKARTGPATVLVPRENNSIGGLPPASNRANRHRWQCRPRTPLCTMPAVLSRFGLCGLAGVATGLEVAGNARLERQAQAARAV